LAAHRIRQCGIDAITYCSPLDTPAVDWRKLPLEARRAQLGSLVAGIDAITFSEGVAAAEGALVFAKAHELGLEGIVSKRAGSRYRSGVSRNEGLAAPPFEGIKFQVRRLPG
jgi:hypothetical protein